DLHYPLIQVIGFNHDRSMLLVWHDEGRDAFSIPDIKGLTFDGQIVESGFSNPYGAEQIAGTIRDQDENIVGLAYEGITPLYEFVDQDLQNTVLAAQAAFPDSAVRIVSSSDDFEKIIFNVSGGSAVGDYYLFDRTQGALSAIGSSRPGIDASHIGYVEIIEYTARDGMVIPALLTWPAGVEPGNGKNLPLVVLPHGGPEAHDELGFDWMAQLPASRGMLVIQPQFRGSDGFGREFRDAGRGRWGKEMQDDVTDAAKYLIDQGYADPDRVCIFGWSYGGYAALAGATFTPEMYRCVIAGAGVSDLPAMLFWEGRETGFESPVVAYWNNVIGDRREDREKLRDISPVNFAARVQAPVLLIHGDDDDVVPIEQSEAMFRALQREGKTVEMVELKDEDHWMSTGEGRMKTAVAVIDFLEEQLLGK
ncbi:alpha/beta hydrolase family protein, partial [Henriciella pelagia]